MVVESSVQSTKMQIVCTGSLNKNAFKSPQEYIQILTKAIKKEVE